LFALNAQTGCTYWSFKTQGGIRNAITVAEVPVGDKARTLVLFTDLQAFAYALDAETGELVWQEKVDSHQAAMGTGALKYHEGKVYVPIAGLTEEALANGKNDYQCCSFRGSVTALDAATGKELWKTYTAPEPTLVRKLDNGKELWGPAGIAVWSTPTIDSKRGLLYIGTGNAYVEPPIKTSNAIVAMDLKTGAIKWSNQTLANDIWSGGCDVSLGGNPDNLGCHDPVGPDFDFSASPVLVTMDNGKDILIATQKSGLGYGMDPDNNGKVVWEYRWGIGAAPGGVYGTASDGKLAYFAVADQRTESPGGLHAVDIKTGKRVWFAPPTETLCKAGPGCGISHHAAVTSIPGVALSASVDGGLRAYSAKTGEIIWTYDANQPYESVNGVKANGGSIDVSSAIVVNGMLYISAGNGGPFGTPGNVILAFALE
jgi:polyvinyl alcohol dehydrogenase (cytochrome)